MSKGGSMKADKKAAGSPYDLKRKRLNSIIERLEQDIPLEGKRWQRNMIAHYTRKRDELDAEYGGKGL